MGGVKDADGWRKRSHDRFTSGHVLTSGEAEIGKESNQVRAVGGVVHLLTHP
jgi:hypothetical protein